MTDLGPSSVAFEIKDGAVVVMHIDTPIEGAKKTETLGRMDPPDIDLLLRYLPQKGHGESEVYIGNHVFVLTRPEHGEMLRDRLNQLRGALEAHRKGRVSPGPEAPAESQISLLCSLLDHRVHVRRAIQSVTHDLERRAEEHDESKLRADEFAGFARINRIAHQHAYGTPQYKSSLALERPTIERHYARNSHHPEHFGNPALDMSFLDIIEMVCDWFAAWRTYNPTVSSRAAWEESLHRSREKYGDVLSPEQWWLIDQVAKYVYDSCAARIR